LNLNCDELLSSFAVNLNLRPYNQEPGSEADIKKFAKKKFGTTFPLFAKVEVNGRDLHSFI
jgi:glutathione peroxidase-family protein